MLTDIKNFSIDQIKTWLETNGVQVYRAGQIFNQIYLHQADDFNNMTNLSKELRRLLAQHYTISRLEKVKKSISKDGSEKYIFKLTDGNLIETVLIPEKNHATICISCQVGCALGCQFCRTAQNGFIRNLTSGEIIAQVRDIRQEMDNPQRLTNIVLMGMGEPLANYQNVVKAVNTLTDRHFGLQFASRRVTLSTAGIIPKIALLGHDTNVNLAISLNAADNDTRSRLMPVNRKYPLKELLNACRGFPLKPRRRITIEYVLIKGINASTADAHRLARLLRPLKVKINLIPYNEYGKNSFQRPEFDTIQAFREILVNHHYTVIIRHSKGRDISAACGQLRAQLL
ncbi:23S rRNA (adenine(2503)-C(2))-methyltransferase RlmN [Desulfococcaceae bacterium HSG9]|nr:23S rRNA (adenine(2503)-C(2))-methyltransferase RlmN [Desulfococcaceae bacterium HSG9]